MKKQFDSKIELLQEIFKSEESIAIYTEQYPYRMRIWTTVYRLWEVLTISHVWDILEKTMYLASCYQEESAFLIPTALQHLEQAPRKYQFGMIHAIENWGGHAKPYFLPTFLKIGAKDRELHYALWKSSIFICQDADPDVLEMGKLILGMEGGTEDLQNFIFTVIAQIEGCVPVFESLLKSSKDWKIRESAAHYLGMKIGCKVSSLVLQSGLNDSNIFVAYECACSMLKHKMPDLQAFLDRPDATSDMLINIGRGILRLQGDRTIDMSWLHI